MPTVDVTHEAAARKASLSPDSREVSEGMAALVGPGSPLHTVSSMLGHSDPAMTLRRYAHVLAHILEDAARAMDELGRWTSSFRVRIS
jgi:hypothetical protein